MAKINKKHQTLSLRAMPLEELIGLARNNFDQGNFRIARDAYKELIRIDRSRFLPELLLCYNCLAQQMIDKKQINEAKIVIDLIKELGGENAVTVCIDPAGKVEHAFEIPMFFLEGKLSKDQKTTEKFKFKAADWAVAKGIIPQETDDDIKSHFQAILAAIASLCARDFEMCTEHLKPVSFGSPFSQWKLLVRGMSSFYRGEDSRAEKIFLKIAPDTVPSKIAKAFLVLLNHPKYLTKTDSDREETVENACVLSCHEELRDSLPRAHYFWMTKRYRDSLIHMQNNCESFPVLDHSIVGTLSNFYYNSIHSFKEKELGRYFPLLYNAKRNAKNASGYNKTVMFTEFFAERSNGNFLMHTSESLPDDIVSVWDNCYKVYRNLFGDDSFLKAELYLNIAMRFMLDVKEGHSYDNPFMQRVMERASELAETCLEKSLELNKSKEAYILLIQLYRNSKRKTDCRVLIENATKDFPLDKKLLVEAGLMAQSRDAYTKAVEFLERAFKVDMVDSGLRRQLISTLVGSARKAPYTKNGLKRMRTSLSRAEQLCTPGSQGYLDDPVYIKIRRAALEFLHGNEEDGNRELQQVYTSSIDPLKLDFFSLFVFRIFGVSPKYYARLYGSIQKTLFAPAKIDKAMGMVHVVSFARNFQNASMLKEDFNRIFKYVAEAFKKRTFTPQEVKVCYTLADEMRYKSTCKTIIQYALKASPEHPLYRFYQYKLVKEDEPFYNIVKIRSWKRLLETLLSDALRVHDLETTALIRKELEQLSHEEKNARNAPLPFGPSMDDLLNMNPAHFDTTFNSDHDSDNCDGDCENCNLCDDDYDEEEDDDDEVYFKPQKRKRPVPQKRSKGKKK